MKASFGHHYLWVILPWLMLSDPSHAVIVAGTSGTGNNNNTQGGLDTYLSGNSLAAFPYWQNLVRVNDASGVYLGYNSGTSRGWVLSANHIAAPTTIRVNGNDYTVRSGTQIGTSDLKLYEIGGGSDPELPSLSSIPLSSSLASNGDFNLMFGRGFTNNTIGPDYNWAIPGTNDSNGMRWGTNTVSQLATVSSNPYIVTDFSGSPSHTAYEAQGSNGDSGGGMFIYRSGQWQLVGIAHFVDDGTEFLELIETGDGIVDPSQIGDFTAYSDVFSHLSSIQGLTGTLIPEPSTLLLAATGICLMLRRRR